MLACASAFVSRKKPFLHVNIGSSATPNAGPPERTDSPNKKCCALVVLSLNSDIAVQVMCTNVLAQSFDARAFSANCSVTPPAAAVTA
eukprot:4663223-Pyramimonas_sp.AAC.1